MPIAARFLLFCLAVLAFPAIAASRDQGDSDGFIQVDAGLLSVKLNNVPLNKVLRTLGEQAGVPVSIQGNLGNVQPQLFQDIPLSEGIKRLVQNSNADLIMIYSRDTAGYLQLQEIRAYEGHRHILYAPAQIPTPAPPPVPVPAGF